MIKNPPANAGEVGDSGLILGLGRSPGIGNGNSLPWSRKWQVFLPGESPGQKSLAGYCP